LVSDMQHWIDGERVEIPETLKPLDAVRHHPARKQCVMLCWNALASGLEQDSA
jgi:nitrogen fixation NifU-like protein